MNWLGELEKSLDPKEAEVLMRDAEEEKEPALKMGRLCMPMEEEEREAGDAHTLIAWLS